MEVATKVFWRLHKDNQHQSRSDANEDAPVAKRAMTLPIAFLQVVKDQKAKRVAMTRLMKDLRQQREDARHEALQGISPVPN